MPDPTPTPVTPLPGKTTIDDKMSFEPERLSYESAVEIAASIVRKIRDAVQKKVVVIAGTRLLADFANLRAVYVLLDGLRRDYDSLGAQARALSERRALKLPGVKTFAGEAVQGLVGEVASAVGGAVSSVIAPATALVGATLGLVSLFRQDVEYHGEKTPVDALAFEIALAAQVKACGAQKVCVPDLVVLPAPQDGQGSLQARLNDVQKAKAAAWIRIGPLISELVRLEGELDEAAKAKRQAVLDRLSAEVSNLRRDLAPVTDPLARLDQRLSDLQSQLSQVEPATGLLQLARLLRAESLQALDPLYLHASVVSSGGHYRITHNLLRTLFVGDGLSFAGGATARWALLDKDGSVASGGVETAGLQGKFGRKSRLRGLLDRVRSMGDSPGQAA